MSVTKLHWMFKERFNKLSSNFYQDLTPMQIDNFINHGVFMLLQRASLKEDTRDVMDLKSSLIVTYPEQVELEPDVISDNRYEFRLSALKYKYFHYEVVTVNTDCGYVLVTMEQYNRINDLLADHMQRPSKVWNRLIGTVAAATDGSGPALFVYSEEGFTVTSLRLEYLRMPKPVFFGLYDTLEYLDCVKLGESDCSQYKSKNSSPQDLEIDDNYQHLVIEYAVGEAARVLGMADQVNLNQEALLRIQS